MKFDVVELSTIAEVRLGRQRSPKHHTGTNMRAYLRAANVGWGGLKLGDVKFMNFTDDEMKTYRLQDGDILLSEASGSPAEVGKPALWSGELDDCAFQNTLIRVRPHSADPRYLLQFFQHQASTGAFARESRGVGIYHLGAAALSRWRVPLPPISEQRRIAKILHKAEAVRIKRREALSSFESVAQSMFLDAFGDPATNSRGWPTRTLGSLATTFSDGPFGSNLKSSHYVDDGVRVIRLQNIGVGRFLDDDRAYVTPEHFASLRRHRCLPGDVLIGTLGDPNLRACMQPEWLGEALNKADCVQMRVDQRVATPSWVCTLLNMPGALQLANPLVLGQTRSRISMGRLRNLEVPVPPRDLQAAFSVRLDQVNRMREKFARANESADELVSSLRRAAFSGGLTSGE